MVLLKIVRQYSREEYHEDSALDEVAYAGLHAECLSESMREAKQEVSSKGSPFIVTSEEETRFSQFADAARQVA